MGWMNREPAEPELPNDLNQALSGLRAKAPECPRPELLQAAQSDVLPAELAHYVNKHVESCPTCKALLADLQALDSVPLERAEQTRIWKKIESSIAVQKPTTGRDRLGTPWRNLWLRPVLLASAAVTVIVVAVVLVWVQNRAQPGSGIAGNHSAAQLPTPAASVLQLEKAPVVLPASAAIIWRGKADPAAKQGKDLKEALAPYESGDYAEAARRLERLRKRYPRMAQATFYLGVSQLFLDRNEDAARSLKDASSIAGSSIADETAWYLALANHRLGDDDDAASILKDLCNRGGKYADRACAGAKELKSRP